MRHLFRIEKRINPKAMGLFVRAYTRIFEATGDASFLQKAKICADWLLRNPSTGYPGLSWGYPFDWQSIVLIPRGTPSAVVSSIIGDGLWNLARVTGDARYADACDRIVQFLLRGLNKTEFNGSMLCFSYTPIDHYLVHSANLLAAEFIARIGRARGKSEWLDIAVRAGNFALSEMNDDGSLFYWGHSQNANSPNHLDCYHSGFEIRALIGLAEATGDSRFDKAARKYFHFFHKKYLRSDGAVQTLPGRLYPIDIHACAEMLLCTAVAQSFDAQRSRAFIGSTLPWILRTMRNTDGSFAYVAYSPHRIIRLPYIRWGQAWMLCALSEIAAWKETHNAS